MYVGQALIMRGNITLTSHLFLGTLDSTSTTQVVFTSTISYQNLGYSDQFGVLAVTLPYYIILFYEKT